MLSVYSAVISLTTKTHFLCRKEFKSGHNCLHFFGWMVCADLYLTLNHPHPDATDLVAGVQDMLQVLAHAVVLDGKENRVEDDAERHHKVEQGVVDHREENVLGPQPALVVQAAGLAAGTVPVVARLYIGTVSQDFTD